MNCTLSKNKATERKIKLHFFIFEIWEALINTEKISNTNGLKTHMKRAPRPLVAAIK